jgi:two-component system cell cycle sensor histidine kinase/response regulator CckA
MSDEIKSNPPAAKGPGALIYVVDDEPMLLELASVILEPKGYRLQTFRDPELAVQTYAASQPRPDLIITDYAMHTMNGMQLIERLHKLEPKQKILMVSGTVGEEIFEGSTSRPDDFIAKPYQAEQLTSAVKHLLERR